MKTFPTFALAFFSLLLVCAFVLPVSHVNAEPKEQIALSAVQINALINDNVDLLEEELDADITIVGGRVSLSGSGLVTYQADSITTTAMGGINAQKVLATGTVSATNCTVQFTRRSLSPITLNLVPFEATVNTALSQYLSEEKICVESVKVTPVQVIYVYHPLVAGEVINNGQSATSTPDTFPVSTGGIVPQCGKPGLPNCDFNMLLSLVNNLISYLLFVIATPLVALILVYVGWLYLSSGGSAENIGKAKKILGNVIIGYIIGLAAWLIINTILVAVGFNGPTFLK